LVTTKLSSESKTKLNISVKL